MSVVETVPKENEPDLEPESEREMKLEQETEQEEYGEETTENVEDLLRHDSKESSGETIISGTFSEKGFPDISKNDIVEHTSRTSIDNKSALSDPGSYLEERPSGSMKWQHSSLHSNLLSLEAMGYTSTPYFDDSTTKQNELSQKLHIGSDITFGTDDISIHDEVLMEIPRQAYPECSLFEKQVLVAVLGETFKQLKLLQRCLPFPAFAWKKVCETSGEYLNKVMSQIPERIFPDYYEFENDRLWKIQVHLYEITNVIFNTTKELYYNDCYGNLVNFLEEIRYRRYQENIVVQENGYLRKLSNAFKKKLAKKELLYNKVETEETEFSTKEEMIFDTKILMQIEKRYTEAWERERRNQNTMKIDKEENVLIDKLKQLAYSQRNDNRLLNEIETFLLLEIGDLETQLQEWTNLYNNELEERDVELTQMYAEKESIDNRLKTMLITYNEREEKVQEIKSFFAERAKEEEIKFYRNKGATIIQRWWRKYQKIKKNFMHQQKLLKKQMKEAKAAAAAAAAKRKKKV